MKKTSIFSEKFVDDNVFKDYFLKLCTKGFSGSLITNSMVDLQNSKWSTQTGGCKVCKFHIFSKFSTYSFDVW